MVTSLVTVAFSSDHNVEHMHMNAVRKRLVKRPEDWLQSSYNNLAMLWEADPRVKAQANPIRLG
jgi:hypothetical protein